MWGVRRSGQRRTRREVLTGQVISKASCTELKSLGTPMSYIPHCWLSDASAQLETALVEKTSGTSNSRLGHPLLAGKHVRQGTVAETSPSPGCLNPRGSCHRESTPYGA